MGSNSRAKLISIFSGLSKHTPEKTMPYRTLFQNNYVAKCGATKHINCDNDQILMRWYRLHRSRCDVCKDVPYKMNNESTILTKDKASTSLLDTITGNPILGAQDGSTILKYHTIKDKLTKEQKEKTADVAKATLKNLP